MKLLVAVAFMAAFLGSSVSAEDATTYLSRADAQFKAGQYRQAVQSYQHVVQLQPNNAQAYHRLGDAYEHLGMTSQAADAWEKEASALTHGTSPVTTAHVEAGRSRSIVSTTTGKQTKYRAGQRVEYVDYGKWYKAIIVKVRDDAYAPYRVHPLGYITTMDHWVPASYIRAQGSGSTEPVPGGEANDVVLRSMRSGTATRGASTGAVAQKSYHCVFFVVDHLVDAAPFTINGGGAYTDRDGVRGTYTMNAATLTFHGGNYNGQKAEYDISSGRPMLYILGPSGRRAIDCD
jgi:hypothetical protein